jgi:glycosyltransferase involved in cell wall biosynthesis
MRITISILCYNYGRYLKKAIDSSLGQKYCEHFEIDVLVVDDGSTDNTPEVCSAYGGLIRVLRSENQGFGASLTKSVSESLGEYICFLDADDYFADHKISALTPYLLRRHIIISHDQIFVSEDSQEMPGVRGGGNTSTICIRKDAAMAILPVENEAAFHSFFYGGLGIKLNLPLTYYRIHEKSMTDRRSPGIWNDYLRGVNERMASNLLRLRNSLVPEPFPNHGSLIRSIKYFKATALYCQLEASLERQHRFKAFLAFLLYFPAALSASMSPQAFIFICKMLAKTIVCRPSFPKNV